MRFHERQNGLIVSNAFRACCMCVWDWHMCNLVFVSSLLCLKCYSRCMRACFTHSPHCGKHGKKMTYKNHVSNHLRKFCFLDIVDGRGSEYHNGMVDNSGTFSHAFIFMDWIGTMVALLVEVCRQCAIVWRKVLSAFIHPCKNTESDMFQGK